MEQISRSNLLRLFERVQQLEERLSQVESQIGTRFEPPSVELVDTPEPIASIDELPVSEPDMTGDAVIDSLQSPVVPVIPEPETAGSAAVLEQAPAPIVADPPAAEPPQPPPAWVQAISERIKSTEFWLNTLGIGLVLFGLIFAYLYAVGQGWITDPIRIGLGYSVGLTLLGVGLNFGLMDDRPFLGQVLAGGGIAALYMTTYVGNVWYELIGFPLATGLMSTITITSYGIAVWKQRPIMAHVGLLGGLLTPIILTFGAPPPSVSGLYLYAGFVLVGAAAIYYRFNWEGLLVTGSIGAIVIFFLPFDAAAGDLDSLIPNNRIIMTSALIFMWAVFGALPVYRVIIDHRSGTLPLNSDGEPRPAWLTLLYGLGVPVLCGVLLAGVWDWMVPGTSGRGVQIGFGLFLIVMQIAYTYVGLRVEPLGRPLESVGTGMIMIGLMALTGGIAYLFEGDALYIILVLEAIALHYVAAQSKRNLITLAGHILVVGLFLATLPRIMPRLDGELLFWNEAFIPLFIFVLGLFANSFLMRSNEFREAYRIGAYTLIMTLIGTEFRIGTANGNTDMLAWVWLIFSGGVYLTGRTFNRPITRNMALIGFGIAMWVGHGSVFVGEMGVPGTWLTFSTLSAFGVLFLGEMERIHFERLIGFVLLTSTAAVGLLNPAISDSNFIELIYWAWLLFSVGLLLASTFFGFKVMMWQSAFVLLMTAGMSLILMGLELVDVGEYIAWPGLWLVGLTAGFILMILIADLLGERLIHSLGGISLIGLLSASTLILVASTSNYRLLFINGHSLGVLLMILAVGCLAIFIYLRPWSVITGLIAHLMFLVWFALNGNEISTGLVTALWSAYAVGLIVLSIVLQNEVIRRFGLGTLFLVIAKLFLVDLSDAEPIIRVLLFGGLGAVLLGVSYFMGSVWRKMPTEVDRADADSEQEGAA